MHASFLAHGAKVLPGGARCCCVASAMAGLATPWTLLERRGSAGPLILHIAGHRCIVTPKESGRKRPPYVSHRDFYYMSTVEPRLHLNNKGCGYTM